MLQIDRVILIVLDSVGIGELPDAAEYGDAGSNTLVHVAEAVGGLNLPNLAELGLANIISICGVSPADHPSGCYGKMAEISKGKDTTTGHWELMGVITDRPFPVYPNGFPKEIIEAFESAIGRRTLGNIAASGTEIIKNLGEEHLRTGCPIVYTSADSVFQIAAHEDAIPVEELYEMCLKARAILVEPHNVQRVIARPFIGEPGSFVRTDRRKDFSLPPHNKTLLELINENGGDVIGIGKIEDIFAGRGITKSIHTSDNADGIQKTMDAIASGQGRMIFTNLVDFDMKYGHRNDPAGYAKALEEFDKALPEIIHLLARNDLLIITADHGCDPTTPSTDHSREYVPVLVYGRFARYGVDIGTRSCFCDLAATIADLFNIKHSLPGTSFADILG